MLRLLVSSHLRFLPGESWQAPFYSLPRTKRQPCNRRLPPEKEMTARISPEERAHWLQCIQKHDLPEGWIENILAAKPPTVATSSGSEYLALCDLDDAGEIIIRGVTASFGGKHSGYIFTLSYPDPEARVQTNLFDI
jgi:hypothetical protein